MFVKICLRHFTAPWIKLMVQQLASFSISPDVSYHLSTSVWNYPLHPEGKLSSDSLLDLNLNSPHFHLLFTLNVALMVLTVCYLPVTRVGDKRSSQTTAGLVSRQQRRKNIQSGIDRLRSCLRRSLLGKYKVVWLGLYWVIFQRISTVVTVPAGLLRDKVNIIDVILAPWCIYSPNRAGI